MSVRALHLVGDHHVGVQIRVTGAAVPMVKGRGDHALSSDLGTTLRPGPGKQHPLLQEGQDVVDGSPVRLGHGLLLNRAREGPQHTGRFRHGEGEVEPGHRDRTRAVVLAGLDLGHRTGVRLLVEIGRQRRDTGRDPLLHRRKGRIGPPQRHPGERISPGTE
jgi:hypothetical protein